jgi:hypothetical protein
VSLRITKYSCVCGKTPKSTWIFGQVLGGVIGNAILLPLLFLALIFASNEPVLWILCVVYLVVGVVQFIHHYLVYKRASHTSACSTRYAICETVRVGVS